MPRYVVLYHELPSDGPRASHWDLMLEEADHLRTWALAEPPDAVGEIDAVALADHRVAYLDYEGPVSGNRGTVTRWDEGRYETVSESDAVVELEFSGPILLGIARLRRSTGAPDQWRYRFAPS